MTRVLALVADLMFGSRLAAAMNGAGLQLELVADEQRVRERLADPAAGAWDVLVVDLTDADIDGAALVRSLGGSGELGTTRTLGFYAHVDPSTRERAVQAGFDLVVPRSRMARESAALVERLSA